MSYLRSAVRIAAAFCAICALAWLVDNVDTHGNQLQTGLANALAHDDLAKPSMVRGRSAGDVPPASDVGVPPAPGLDLIDMYECMCGPSPATDIKGWVGLWLVTVLIGGLPTAVLIRARRVLHEA
jgi:hypothetical protein